MGSSLCGVDGCKGGWAVVYMDGDTGAVSCQVFPTFAELANRQPAVTVIAIDIPVGLPNVGARACDVEARGLLGGRASSIFPAPIRPILAASTYGQACRIGRAREEKAISKQTWAILPKIREVDCAIRKDPAVGARVWEIHPELCFYRMNGCRPMPDKKRSIAGQLTRVQLLTAHVGDDVLRVLRDDCPGGCAADDIIDAFAALWTARRIAAGEAVTIPSVPERDHFGLPMRMMA